SEQRINKNLDVRIAASESMLLRELDRVHSKLQEKIEDVQKNMDELNQYYRITRLENDCTQIVLQKIEQIDKRLEALEKRSA
ncbi:MAG TPA: hypothetical protein DF613_03570, partial [Lachnospiraceae bacterium]|nr:hypothetical protein [Lachnospiraceae bacterium]